jgi:hypothetical protein
MMTDKVKELTALRAKAAALEQQIATERNQELAALPSRYGFASANEFIAAVRAASDRRRGRKPGAKKAGGRKARAVITDEMRAEVKKLVAAGKTGAEIAAALKISLPSVQNIKKALGLVRK